MSSQNTVNWQWIQHRLFLLIRVKIENDSIYSFTESIQAVLKIKKSAVYNRISAKTPLKIGEMLILMHTYNIDISDIIGEELN